MTSSPHATRGRSFRIAVALAALLLVGPFAIPASAAVLNLREAPCSAVGDGKADDRAALVRAFEALKPGDTLLVPPGDYRVVLTKERLKVPAGVKIVGVDGRSRFLLASDGGPKSHREFLGLAGDVTLQGLTIERAEPFPTILLPTFGEIDRLTLRDCVIDGRGADHAGYCHAIQVGYGTLRDFKMLGVTIRDCDYGLFQPNQANGVVDGVLVDGCRFEHNASTDLEFNAPKSTMKNIVVRRSHFADNRCGSPSGGFAVGFANVKDGLVEHCVIRNYGSEALHVEDRSENITLTGNTIVSGSTRQPNGVVMVLSGSRNVSIEGNVIDARGNENNPHLVLVTAGGDRFKNPSDVSVVGNVLLQGPSTRLWYLQPGSGPKPTGNTVVPYEAPASE